MNFFFGFKNKDLKSELTIPKFNNNSDYKNHSVFSAKPKDNEWIIEQIKCEEDYHFYYVDNKIIENDLFFFLADQKKIQKKNYKDIKEFSNKNNFTDTRPSAFRANFKIYITGGGFSSYQSEYPHTMSLNKGNILSPTYSLLNKEADKNLILFRNIFHVPNNDETKIFFVDIKLKKILHTTRIKNNFSNEIVIDKNLIDKNIFLFSEQALGIPIYISIKNNHISLEHTHPPHHYILSDNRFDIVSGLKKEIKKVINEDH